MRCCYTMVQISATAAACRVFVRSNPCVFGNSVFDEIFKGCEDPQRRHCDHYDRGLVSLEEKDGKVHLSTTQKDKRCVTALPMGRAKDCPSLGSTPCPTTVNRKIVEKTPFVGLAVVGLVLDSTGEHLLITRRPSYMRAFPGAWVFPGGGVDLQESLIWYANNIYFMCKIKANFLFLLTKFYCSFHFE